MFPQGLLNRFNASAGRMLTLSSTISWMFFAFPLLAADCLWQRHSLAFRNCLQMEICTPFVREVDGTRIGPWRANTRISLPRIDLRNARSSQPDTSEGTHPHRFPLNRILFNRPYSGPYGGYRTECRGARWLTACTKRGKQPAKWPDIAENLG